MRSSAGWIRRREYHDHVGLHTYSRNRHSARQRLLRPADCGHDLRRIGGCFARGRGTGPRDRKRPALCAQAGSRAARLCGRNAATCRHAHRNSAGFDHRHCRRALSGSLRHAHPSGGGAALRMNSSTTAQKNTEPRVVLRAEGVWKSYDDGAISVLKGVAFEVIEGQTVALCGPSGCGKSTLLHLFGGLDFPEQGRVSVNGAEVNRHRNLLHLLRHEVGFVFQLHNLIPDLTLEENCLIPTVAAGIDHRHIRTRSCELTERTGLSHRLDHRIQKLSGGERQRTALCRALMNKPRILLADEPTGSLDEQASKVIFDLLLELVATEGATLLMATHDRSLAGRCDRLVEMHDGKIHEHAHAG